MIHPKRAYTFMVAVVLLGALATSCGSSSYHSGCPGKDRPSYRGYGMTAPNMQDFKVNPKQQSKDSDAVCFNAQQIDA